MGLVRGVVEMMLREHRYRPLSGHVITIGRQSVYLSSDDLTQMLNEMGIGNLSRDAISVDEKTVDRASFHFDDQISDTTLFASMGIDEFSVLDISDYEGANIIHDLNQPLPEALRGIADVVIDGSSLDNTFRATATLQNYCDLLKPGGRLIAVNAFSPHNTPYAIIPPMTFFDYFVVNGFVDCKVYVQVRLNRERAMPTNTFYLDPRHVENRRRGMGRMVPPAEAVTLVFAEKGVHSTTDRTPVQQDYRSDADWAIYCERLRPIRESRRPHLARSSRPFAFPSVEGGHILINEEFEPAWE